MPDALPIVSIGVRELTIPSYERAVEALRECLAFEDTKYWSDFSEAYQAWAKINGAKDAIRLCKALKLQVARRMGELAYLAKNGGKPNPTIGRPPGPHSFLVDKGLSRSAAACALHLARMNKYDFEQLTTASNPPSPINPKSLWNAKPSTAFNYLTQTAQPFLNFCKKYPVEEYEQFIYETERPISAERVKELLAWMTPMTIWCGEFLGDYDRSKKGSRSPQGLKHE